MTDNPFSPKSNDLAVKFVPQTSPTDPRTVLAEEFNLNSSLGISLFISNRKKRWIEPLTVAPTSIDKQIKITGRIQLEINPHDIVLNHKIIIPNLTEAPGSIFRRDDIVTLIGLAAEVGEEQDIVLGKVGFRYEDTQTNTIKTIEKENGRRIRSFWLLALNDKVTTNSHFLDILVNDTNTGEKLLTIANKDDIGFTVGGVGGIKLYALDDNWALKNYKIVSGSVTTTPLCSVTRFQNYRENGYIYGLNGEEPFSELSLNDISDNFADGEQIDITTQIKKAVREIASGEKRKGSRRKKAILNFINGQAGNNPNNPGIAAIAMNGTYCLGNDQRIQFTNQKSMNKLFVARTQAIIDENENIVAGIGLNINAPFGSYFSENREDHKIYSLDGVDRSALGQFSNLRGNNYNSLTWTFRNNGTIVPGQSLLFVPAIRYPSGSGMSIPYSYISKAWKDGILISPGNIRFGMDNDLNAYESPVNNESFIIIYGSERTAIHYIYKKISVVSSTNGTLVLPSTEKGCFAFVDGINGRLDTPVVTGLASSTSYNALCYYPPRSTETWQFELVYTDYQGKTDKAAFLDNAIVCSEPICFFHTSGGGLSVHRGDAKLAASPISLHLPAIESVVKSYDFDSPISFAHEPYENPISWKEDIEIFSAANLVYPTTGQKIGFTAGNLSLAKSISGILKYGSKTLGLKVPPISGGNSFQAVIAFAVEKERKRMLVIATKNCIGNTPIEIALDSSQTAFDLFEI